MKTEDHINGYINREKQIECNPYLSTRIMAKIEAPKQKSRSALRIATVAASVSLAIMLGVVAGNSYVPDSRHYSGLNINDSEMENFALYNSDDNE